MYNPHISSHMYIVSVLDDRSSSDEENYNMLLSSPEPEELENKNETPSIFGIDLNVNETSSNDSESEFSDNQSDADDKSLDSFNESDASANNRIECVSENTTHSYSNSLLEDEEDDADDGDIEDEAIKSSHLLSDLNNGECWHLIGDFEPIINDPIRSINSTFKGNYTSASCSESESPTEPLTQKIAAIFRSSFVLPPDDTN